MKNLNLLGRSLSKTEQQHIAGGAKEAGDPGACFNLYEACNDNVQCCSTNCVSVGGGQTGKECRES